MILASLLLILQDGSGELRMGGKAVEVLAKARVEKWGDLGDGELLVRIGREFEGTPYVGGTLEEVVVEKEVCLVDLGRLDCVTFVESVLGLRDVVRRGGGAGDLVSAVEGWRYRGGKADGYLSRLHYSSDWLAVQERNGRMENVTQVLPGAEGRGKAINFMTSHRDSYSGLKEDEVFRGMGGIERDLSRLDMPSVDSSKVAAGLVNWKTGDVVLFAAAAGGLDVAHLGIVEVREGKVGFWHASSSLKRVVFEPDLVGYLGRNRKRVDGVMLGRLVG